MNLGEQIKVDAQTLRQNHPEISERESLIYTSERLVLKMSEDPRYPEDKRHCWQPERIGSGAAISWRLRAFPVDNLDALNWQNAPTEVSAVYKPRLQALGAQDNRFVYMRIRKDSKSLFYSWVNGELIPQTKGVYHDRPLLVPNLDQENPPNSLITEAGELHRLTRMRRGVFPGDEVLRDHLQWILSEALKTYSHTPTASTHDFVSPKTTVEALKHSCFGSHHRVGSRQAWIPHARHHTDFYPDSESSDESLRIADDEIFKIAIQSILSVNLDCNLSNLLLTQDDRLLCIDTGFSFPHLLFDQRPDHARLTWTGWAPTKTPLPRSWVDFIASLDTDHLLGTLLGAIESLNRRFPLEKFKLTPDCQLVFWSAIQFLKIAVSHGLSLAQIGLFMSQEEVAINPTQSIHIGAEFWIALQLAVVETQYDGNTHPIPSATLDAVEKYLRGIVKNEAIFHSTTTYSLQLRKLNDPLVYVWNILSSMTD